MERIFMCRYQICNHCDRANHMVIGRLSEDGKFWWSNLPSYASLKTDSWMQFLQSDDVQIYEIFSVHSTKDWPKEAFFEEIGVNA